jgi:glycosyltransferase involved in cell wall biosynthesis
MTIYFIVPGSGDAFYCGNCFRDNLEASALRKAGHDVLIMPLYLPLRQASFQSDTPLYFPAASYYTALKFFKGECPPRWMQRLMDSDFVLRLSASLSGTTSAKGMEALTLSMIRGEEPVFQEQAWKIFEWLDYEGPDIVHLSSPLLIGIAKVLHNRMHIPIVCSVQDEDLWIDSLDSRSAALAWQGIAENSVYVDRFVTTSEYYRQYLLRRLPQIKEVEVVYPGVDREQYAAPEVPEAPTIGFFYRMNAQDGLDILCDAFVELKRRNSIPRLKLKIGGGYTGSDKPFLRRVKKRLAPYKDEVSFCEDYSYAAHAAFYRSVSLVCVPVRFDESVGLYLCEAFAAGRPAVEPDTGSFPEILGDAGLLYRPNDSRHLADALEHLLGDKEAYEHAAKAAEQLSRSRYDGRVAAKKLESIYQQIVK